MFVAVGDVRQIQHQGAFGAIGPLCASLIRARKGLCQRSSIFAETFGYAQTASSQRSMPSFRPRQSFTKHRTSTIALAIVGAQPLAWPNAWHSLSQSQIIAHSTPRSQIGVRRPNGAPSQPERRSRKTLDSTLSSLARGGYALLRRSSDRRMQSGLKVGQPCDVEEVLAH